MDFRSGHAGTMSPYRDEADPGEAGEGRCGGGLGNGAGGVPAGDVERGVFLELADVVDGDVDGGRSAAHDTVEVTGRSDGGSKLRPVQVVVPALNLKPVIVATHLRERFLRRGMGPGRAARAAFYIRASVRSPSSCRPVSSTRRVRAQRRTRRARMAASSTATLSAV